MGTCHEYNEQDLSFSLNRRRDLRSKPRPEQSGASRIAQGLNKIPLQRRPRKRQREQIDDEGYSGLDSDKTDRLAKQRRTNIYPITPRPSDQRTFSTQSASSQSVPQINKSNTLPTSKRLEENRSKKHHRDIDDTEEHQVKKSKKETGPTELSFSSSPYLQPKIDRWLGDTRNPRNLKYLENQDSLSIGESFQDTLGLEVDVMAASLRPGESLQSDSTTQSSATARPYDGDYRRNLLPYNIFIDALEPPSDLWTNSMTIIDRKGKSLSQDDLEAKVKIARSLANSNETDIVTSLHEELIPQLHLAPDKLNFSRKSGQIWHKSIPIPCFFEYVKPPLPLSVPKPDVTFGFNAFSPEQQNVAALFEKKNLSLLRPDGTSIFPFLGLEFKAQATKNPRWIAENQESNAGAIIHEGLRRLAMYTKNLDLTNYCFPLYFSIAADHEIATIHIHWMGRDEKSNITYHSYRLKEYVLLRTTEMDAYQQTIQNILHYGETRLFPWLVGLLNECRHVFLASKKDPMEDIIIPPKLKRQRSMKTLSLQSASQQSAGGSQPSVIDEFATTKESQTLENPPPPRLDLHDLEFELPQSSTPQRPMKQRRQGKDPSRGLAAGSSRRASTRALTANTDDARRDLVGEVTETEDNDKG